MTGKASMHSPAKARVRTKWRPTLGAVVGLVLSVVLALPIAGMAAVVVLSRSPEQVVASLVANAGKIAVAGTVILLVTGLVGFLFWRLVTKPVSQLIGWTEAVGKGQAASLDGPGHDAHHGTHYGTRELATLAASFSTMVERLEERSRYIETFTAHVSHELKSPLTSIAGAAELMRDAGDGMDASARKRFLDNIARDTERLSALVARMRELARAETSMAQGAVRLRDLLKTLRDHFPHLDIRVQDEDAVLPVPAVDALAILSHLADNAEKHGARLLHLAVSSRGASTILAVANDGAPISAGNRVHIFDPFYTTRRESGGTGMGLAIVRAMLKAHGGDIALNDDAEQVTFRISLRA